MKVLRLCWLGIPAREYQPMVHLLRDVMGLTVEFEEPTTIELSLPSGDHVQVFAPGDRYFDFFRRESSGPVALFEVDDIHAAYAALTAAGIEIVAASNETATGSGCTSGHLTATSTSLPAATPTKSDLNRPRLTRAEAH